MAERLMRSCTERAKKRAKKNPTEAVQIKRFITDLNEILKNRKTVTG